MSEIIFRVGPYSKGGLNRGEGSFTSTGPDVYMLTKSERISNIPKKEGLKRKSIWNGGRYSRYDSRPHQMLAQVARILAKISAFVDFHLYCSEQDSPHRGQFEGGGLFVTKQLEGEALFEGGA